MTPSIPTGSSDSAASTSLDGGIVQFVDLHADAHFWDSAPGAAVHGHAFNGQVPGPVIEATVGDRLLVQFSNGLDQPTALVWEAPSGSVTPMRRTTPHWVSPGGSHECEHILTHPGVVVYRAIAQTPNTVGGLFGVLLVRSRDERVVDQERILVVHHAELTAASAEETEPPASGNGRPDPPVLLLNGVQHASIDMRAGSRESWRILNVATDVQLRLGLTRRPVSAGGSGGGHPALIPALVPAATTRPAGLDLPMGPFAANQQITLAAITPGDGPARHDRQLLTCHII